MVFSRGLLPIQEDHVVEKRTHMDWLTALFIGLPGWIVLLGLLGGFCLLNIARGFWFLLVLALVGGFAWFTIETIYATFDAGWLTGLLWLALIGVLLVGAGVDTRDRNYSGGPRHPHYGYLAFCLAAVFSVVFLLIHRNLSMSLFDTGVLSFLFLLTYIAVGLWVVALKWKVHNRDFVSMFSDEKRKHFAYLRSNIQKIESEQRSGSGRGDGRWNFSQEEIAALKALPASVASDSEFAVPEALKDAWKRRVAEERALRKPSLAEASAMALYWVAAWPVEFIHFLIDDFMMLVWEKIFAAISGWLLKIQEKEFKKDPDLAS